MVSPINKVMKSPSDASARLDSKRHQNGMKIDTRAVKVMTYMYIQINDYMYNIIIILYIQNRNRMENTQFKHQMEVHAPPMK